MNRMAENYQRLESLQEALSLKNKLDIKQSDKCHYSIYPKGETYAVFCGTYDQANFWIRGFATGHRQGRMSLLER